MLGAIRAVLTVVVAITTSPAMHSTRMFAQGQPTFTFCMFVPCMAFAPLAHHVSHALVGGHDFPSLVKKHVLVFAGSQLAWVSMVHTQGVSKHVPGPVGQ